MSRVFALSLALAAGAASLGMAGAARAQNPTAEDFRAYMAQQHVVRAGMGEDQRLPEGQPVVFPAGVRLSGPILGSVEGDDCGDRTEGSGYNVLVCLSLCNETGQPILARLPSGTIVVSKSASRYQNGMFISDVGVYVPPMICGTGGISLDKDRDELDREGVPPPQPGFRIRVGLYCLNESMGPSEPGVPYALGPVTDDPDIRALLDSLKGVALDEDGREVVQTAIYSITEGRGLTPADRTALRALRQAVVSTSSQPAPA